MKQLALLALTAGVLVAADAPKDAEAKKEQKKLDGSWQVVSLQVDGEKVPDDDVKDYQVTFKDGKYVLKMQDTVISKGTLKLDPSAKPKAVDIMVEEGDNQGQTLKGIYELDGDTFKACYAPPDQKRPTKLESQSGSGHIFITQKRMKK